ncbi:MAG: hypothetical protein H6737_03065 [Alphaproteobacteria bacterium]|nr:hypothetical protein [Alphaproteobacteria bacterium]
MLWMLVGTALATAPPTEREVALGVGAFFNGGGTFMTQPQDRTGFGLVDLPFSGFAGFSPGGGVSVDFRWRDIVGVEVDLIRSIDTAQSEYGINGVDYRFKAVVPSWHIPMMLKAGIPSKGVSPNLFFGVNVVVPGEPEIQLPTPNGIPWQMTAQTKTYSRMFFGLGFEGRLPIDGVDIRIPFTLRGSMATSYPNSAIERAEYDIRNNVLFGMEYDLRWQYHAAVTLGVSYYFL